MGSTVIVETGSKCAGPIVANRIEIGKSGAVLADWRGSWAGQSLKLRVIGKGTRVDEIYVNWSGWVPLPKATKFIQK
jgi:hypothetical protein